MKKILSYIRMLLPALMLLVGCTDIDDFALAPHELTLTAQMPSDNIVTRIMMDIKEGSKSLYSKWLDNDQVRIVITQGDKKYDIGMVRPYNISEDSKRADITFKLPEELDTDQVYTIFAFCNLEGVVAKDEDGSWQAYGTAALQRARIYFLVDIPIFACVDVKNNQIPTVLFQHIGTYELLHLTNASSRKISYKHEGFESQSDKWYWKDANINLNNGTITTGSYGEVDNALAQYDVDPGDTEYYLSWYFPSGNKLNKAYLKANIDGQEVTSVNSKSSDVDIKCGHVYHLYATWNGQKLTFENGNFEEFRTYSVSPETINFGTVKVGDSYHDSFVIKNTGNVPQTFVIEATHDEFEIEKSGQPIQIAPNTSEEIGVIFKPVQYDHAYLKTVHITCEGAEGPQSIILKGQTETQAGETRTYTVTPETIDFGYARVGSSYTKQFTIKNTGDVALQFFIEATHDEFEIEKSGQMFEIKPNETEDIGVIFKPMQYDHSYQKTVSITCQWGDGPQNISLKGHSAMETTSEIQTFNANGVSFNMIKVDGGTFQMGATSEQDSYANSDEKPVHQVTLDDYYIGETEVTQALWTAVMGSNPSHFTSSNQLPVDRVSWHDCQGFVSKLTSLTGKTFRLLTEAEWEYAARGGKASQKFIFSGSNTLDDVAWYGGNSSSQTHVVATKQPNELGIYDMSGNVMEWCSDWYDASYYSSSPASNPPGATSGTERVLRGGAWFDGTGSCRVTARTDHRLPYTLEYRIGLRLAMSSSSGLVAYSQCPDDNHPHLIDIGLSTKWACCNIGAHAPEQDGSYFAWGETEEKSSYNWDTYKFGGDLETPPANIGDVISGTQYDVAHVKWGSTWRMPTYWEGLDLIRYCSHTWTTVNGVGGYKIKGRNGNSIFLPASGFIFVDSFFDRGTHSCCWTAESAYYAWQAYRIYIYSGGHGCAEIDRRYGMPIRPVSD